MKKDITTINIMGFDVEIVLIEVGAHKHYCAYATLKNSQYLNNSFLQCATFREGDKVGVDTAHSWNSKQSLDEKLLDAIYQITEVIKPYIAAIDGDQE